MLGLHNHDVTVQCLRMGGGFGGKEMQPHGFAAVAALGATLTGRPVRLRLTRTQDITMTGKRHGFHAQWRVGFDDDGRLQGLEATLTSDGGWSLDLSEPVLARALCHVDNAYWIPHVRLHGRVARTHKTSQTAFRGFGGPQGMLVIEDILGRCAPLLGLDPLELRRRNFYVDGQATPYGQPVRHPERAGLAWDQVLDTGDVAARLAQVEEFNARHEHVKRALAVTPVKFGISFNFTAFNQAGALVHVYKDGSVLINHGGTEMGQGLHTKMLQVAATSLGIPLDRVRLAPTRTDKVPNTSATAASSGADLNGGAVKHACEQIQERLARVDAGRGLDWEELVREAYFSRVQLWAAGYYRTEGLHWDSTVMQGHPFKYFAYGVAAAEVEVDGFTGAYPPAGSTSSTTSATACPRWSTSARSRAGSCRGRAGSPSRTCGGTSPTVPGAAGWPRRPPAPTSCPASASCPTTSGSRLLEHAHEDGAVYGSKAVGEPPLMLAFCVREALRQAAAAFGPPGTSVDLPSPATPEQVFWAVERARGGAPGGNVVEGMPGVVPDRPDPNADGLHPRSEQVAARTRAGG